MTRFWMERTSAHQLGKARLGPPPPRFFSATSIWNRRLDPAAPLVNDGNNYAQKFAHQCQYTTTSTPVAGYYNPPYNCYVNASHDTMPVWTVPANYPTTRVQWFDNTTNIPHADADNFGLQATWDNVPVPTDIAQLNSNGTDKSVIIYQPSSDTMWEFWAWNLNRTYNGVTYPYTAKYGATITGLSAANGIVPHGWGLRASGLSALGGLMMMQEYLNGGFPHALAMAAVVTTANHIAPATRGDGPTSGTPSGSTLDAVPEGLFLRLPASYTPPSNFTPFLKMVCIAARDYGIYITDFAGVPAMYAEDSRTVNSAYNPLTTSPWSGLNMDINNFPWSQLQQVQYIP